MDDKPQVVVAGHICLDLIPKLEMHGHGLDQLLLPGKLVNVGPAVMSTGGTVSNTGLALYRLGIPTKLMGKIGDDLFGTAILNQLRSCNDALANDMIIEARESSSYTIILSTPGLDRTFLHCPGTNDTFSADDIDIDQLQGARIFHFGYPPVMRRMYIHNGSELATLMQRIKSAGLLTSLDMAYPDPNSEAGQINWSALLERTLPDVDVFLPSLEEILFMLDRPRHDALMENSSGEIVSAIEGEQLSEIGQRLIDLGVAIAVLKLGSQGLYVRTSSDAKRLTSIGAGVLSDPYNWLDRELMVPCFKANVVGTTGAGDCTIAGFIAGFLKGLPIEQTMQTAVAVGACNVESADATSGVPDWDTVQARIRAGWQRLALSISLQGWQHNLIQSIWRGPQDKGGG
ncbi:MAG: carbohydrate kinase family protein [Desulfobacterales bacterium]|nr:MAG: carbohydrate kinase family protein [Desulfobacterales bacterium]